MSAAARRWLPLALPLAGLALAGAALWAAIPALNADRAAARAARTAMAEGNRLVRDGDLDAALAAYPIGWGGGRGGDADALLAYNLGTTLHRAGRRPEALVWYRRAAALRPRDPWLADNLELVRRELAAERLPPPGPAARLAAAPLPLAAAGVAAAWLAAALLAARGRLLAWRLPAALAGGAWAGAAALALALWCAGPLAAALAPEPAVVTGECAAGGLPLPPGSEVWARRTGDGRWSLAAPADALCPAGALAPIGRFSANFTGS